MMLRTLLALLLLVGFPGKADDLQRWSQRMDSRSVRSSVGLWDLATGKLLEGHQTDLALVPASTTKVISTYAILKSLKPDF